MSVKTGWTSEVSAAATFIDPAITAKMNEIRTALIANSVDYPQDLVNVRAARDQLRTIDPAKPTDLNLINPTWNVVKPLFQPEEYQAIREDIVGFIQVLAITYYGDGRELESIAAANQFNDTARKFAAKAGVDQNIKVSDFAEFIFGNESYTGVEPVIRQQIQKLSLPEIYALLSNESAKKQFLVSVFKQVLKQPNVESNVVGKVMKFYDSYSNNWLPSFVQTFTNFEARIPNGVAASRAMMFAVIRTESEIITKKTSSNGTRVELGLNVSNKEAPSQFVEWSVKAGTTPTAKLSDKGIVTIDKKAKTGTVTVVAKLLDRTLAERAVTLTNEKPGQGEEKPTYEEILAQINELAKQLSKDLKAAKTREERVQIYLAYYAKLQALLDQLKD
ncbi:hypothetical protein SY83_08980 [Paenibacillus swuensis]|uniref:Uncharacterized protein n=1 Tax=Paenibacillus swuensis TaxID=1178515 RepID=A0A172TH93_9BACL|nr:hypothetical protein SY83_08980 [Paenibacillus swuensis]